MNTKSLFWFTSLRNIANCVNYLPKKCHFSKITKKMNKVNEFFLMDYDIIGFDLDGTLLRYNLSTMTPLIYEILIKYLVEEANYPKPLLKKQFDKDFIQKGLIIDAERGNIIKLNTEGKIIKATHGTTFLNEGQIRKIYGVNCQWSLAQNFIKDPLSIWNGPNSTKFRIVLDYFDFASTLVFAQVIDVLDEILSKQNNLAFLKSDYNVYPDILKGLIRIYTWENFSNGQSDYFEALKSQPNKYLIRTNEMVLTWLKHLRSSGKVLYLLTGSNIDFANFTASYAIGKEWRDLFHMIIFCAKKPGFFSMERPFLCTNIQDLLVVPNSEVPISENLNIGNTYAQGNWPQLRKSLNKQLIHKKDINTIKSVYIGDNLIQDVYAPTKYSKIHTIAISEELWANDNTYEFKDIVESKVWGSYFNLNNTPTIWSKIINEFSQLCIPNLDVIAKEPLIKLNFM